MVNGNGLAGSAEQEAAGAAEEPTIRGRMVAAEEVAVPHFTAEWDQIRKDVEEVGSLTRAWGAAALRVGQNLIKIRDELKPLKLWLSELEKRGWSQSSASRYIRFAEMPEGKREVWLRGKHFSLSAAVGEGRGGKNGAGANVEAGTQETSLDEAERAERLAEVAQLLKLGIRVVEAGEKTVVAESESGWSEEDDARFRSRLSIAADALLVVARDHLEAELKRRLLPHAEVRP